MDKLTEYFLSSMINRQYELDEIYEEPDNGDEDDQTTETKTV